MHLMVAMLPPPDRSTSPPREPETQPRLRPSRGQRVGLPLMALTPLLALVGFFGERRAQVQAGRGFLLVSAQVPTRFRYRQRMSLELNVTNRGSATVHDVRVRIDSAYLDRFSAVTLVPHVSPDGSVPLDSLAGRETRRVTVTLEGERAGAIRGTAVAADAEGDSARIVLASTVFP